jgi:hypothetical protein
MRSQARPPAERTLRLKHFSIPGTVWRSRTPQSSPNIIERLQGLFLHEFTSHSTRIGRMPRALATGHGPGLACSLSLVFIARQNAAAALVKADHGVELIRGNKISARLRISQDRGCAYRTVVLVEIYDELALKTRKKLKQPHRQLVSAKPLVRL